MRQIGLIKPPNHPVDLYLIFVRNRGDTILCHGRLHTDLNQCPHWFKSVQSRDLGQSNYIICTSFFNNNWCTMVSKKEKSDTFFFHIFFLGVGGFQKSYVIFRGGISKYLLFLTGVGGWCGKGQKHPYVI